MTTVYIFGGPSKRDIVQAAYEVCGQAGYEFELTSEEYASALRRLDGMMNQWKVQRGVDLGYNFTSYGTGEPSDESGIPDDCFEVVAEALARRVAPGIGKSLGAEANSTHANALSLMLSTYTTVPTMSLRATTPRGSGNWRTWDFGDYFPPSDT